MANKESKEVVPLWITELATRLGVESDTLWPPKKPTCVPYAGCANHWPLCHECGMPSVDEKAVPGLLLDSFDRKDKKDHDKLVCRACHPVLGRSNYRWPT